MGKKTFRHFMDYIPAPACASLNGRLGFSFLMIAIFIILCMPFDSSGKYIDEMKKFSAAEHAQYLYKTSGPKAVCDYINFYQTLPNYKQDENLNKIREEADKHRASWNYRAEEFGRGLIGLDHHEDYAKIANNVAMYVPYLSDARDIYFHGRHLFDNWNKFKSNENIDSLQLGLDGIGLAASLYGLIPGMGHASEPVKTSTAILRKCLENMKREIRIYIMRHFKNVFTYLSKSGILNINANNLTQLPEMVMAKKIQFDEALALVNSSLNRIAPLITLSTINWDAASIVLQNASTPEELDSYIHIASELDKNSKEILRFGGAPALKAAGRLEKEGELNIDIVKSAMAYGPAGLEAVGMLPKEYFLSNSIKNAGNIAPWRMTALVLFGIYAVLAFIKVWFSGKCSSKRA